MANKFISKYSAEEIEVILDNINLNSAITKVKEIPTLDDISYDKNQIYLKHNEKSLKFIANQQIDLAKIDYIPTPKGITNSAIVKMDDNICYLFGGEDSTGAINSIIKFNSTNNTYEELGIKLPYPLKEASGCKIGSKCYIFGGIKDNNIKNQQCIIFDTSNSRYNISTVLDEERGNYTWTFGYKDKIYIFGGDCARGGEYQNFLTIINPIDMKVENQYQTSSYDFTKAKLVLIDNICYILNLWNKSSSDSHVISFVLDNRPSASNPDEVLIWDEKTSDFGISVIKNQIYLIGGKTPLGNSQKILCFDPIKVAITEFRLELNEPILNTSAIEMGGKIYCFGGKTPANIYSKIIKINDAVENHYSLETLSTTAAADDKYVEKEAGKGLSTNDFTDDLETKLNNLVQGVIYEEV